MKIVSNHLEVVAVLGGVFWVASNLLSFFGNEQAGLALVLMSANAFLVIAFLGFWFDVFYRHIKEVAETPITWTRWALLVVAFVADDAHNRFVDSVPSEPFYQYEGLVIQTLLIGFLLWSGYIEISKRWYGERKPETDTNLV